MSTTYVSLLIFAGGFAYVGLLDIAGRILRPARRRSVSDLPGTGPGHFRIVAGNADVAGEP